MRLRSVGVIEGSQRKICGTQKGCALAVLASLNMPRSISFVAASVRRTPREQSLGISCRNGMLLLEARRFQSNRRPTQSEITEALNVLQADLNMDEKTLKKKYRNLVKKHHPDAGGSEAAMSKVSVAYNVITSLTKRERDEYKQLRKSYKPGYQQQRGPNATRSQSTREYDNIYRESARNAYRTTDSWDKAGDFARAYAQSRQRAEYSRQGGHHKGGLSSSPMNPFRINFGLNRIILKLFFVYGLTSLITMIMYRRYRDWKHDDGWKAAEQIARQEKMEEIQRMRQELAERKESLRRARMLGKDYNYASRDTERVKELRAYDYAEKQMELQAMEMRGWPRFSPVKGKLLKNTDEPVGIVYFEPTVDSSKFRLNGQGGEIKEVVRVGDIDKNPKTIVSHSSSPSSGDVQFAWNK